MGSFTHDIYVMPIACTASIACKALVAILVSNVVDMLPLSSVVSLTSNELLKVHGTRISKPGRVIFVLPAR